MTSCQDCPDRNHIGFFWREQSQQNSFRTVTLLLFNIWKWMTQKCFLPCLLLLPFVHRRIRPLGRNVCVMEAWKPRMRHGLYLNLSSSSRQQTFASKIINEPCTYDLMRVCAGNGMLKIVHSSSIICRIISFASLESSDNETTDQKVALLGPIRGWDNSLRTTPGIKGLALPRHPVSMYQANFKWVPKMSTEKLVPLFSRSSHSPKPN